MNLEVHLSKHAMTRAQYQISSNSLRVVLVIRYWNLELVWDL